MNIRTRITRFAALQPERTFKKSKLVEAVEHRYPNNKAHYVGEALARMMKAGMIRRVKHGHYQLIRSEPKLKGSKPGPNQLQLF